MNKVPIAVNNSTHRPICNKKEDCEIKEVTQLRSLQPENLNTHLFALFTVHCSGVSVMWAQLLSVGF
jgi:hypothetical protein